MKKVFVFILVLVCVSFTVGVNAFADIGPKPSVTIYVNGVEDGREYYVALIENKRVTGIMTGTLKVRTMFGKRYTSFLKLSGIISPTDPWMIHTVR